MLFSLPILVSLAAYGPTVTELDENRFEVSVVFNGESAREHVKAQFGLARAARRHCRKKGEPVSEGWLHVDLADPGKPDDGRLRLSEVYTCEPKG